jgi:hypothetical protein
MLLDEVAPRWHHRSRYAVAASGDLLPAVEALTWSDVPLFRALMSVRMAGRRLPAERPILESMTSIGFAPLGRADDELVYGAIGRPWSPRGGLRAVSGAAAFRAFDEPGWARMALNFHVADGRLSTETRVWLTDPTARRRFRPYWLVVGPFSGAIRMAWLRAAKYRALTTG